MGPRVAASAGPRWAVERGPKPGDPIQHLQAAASRDSTVALTQRDARIARSGSDWDTWTPSCSAFVERPAVQRTTSAGVDANAVAGTWEGGGHQFVEHDRRGLGAATPRIRMPGCDAGRSPGDECCGTKSCDDEPLAVSPGPKILARMRTDAGAAYDWAG